MAILRPVVHREQDGRRRQTLDDAVEHDLRFRVHPVQVFEDEQHRLHAAFAEEHALHAIDGVPATLCRVLREEERVLRRERIEDPQDRRDRVLERAVERQQRSRDLGAHAARVVPVVDAEVRAQ